MKTLAELVRKATNVRHFSSLSKYREFCSFYLEYIESGLQARIVSSKDRLDKIFIDKLLFNRLAGKELPFIAIFLNDIQRKKSKSSKKYGVNSTFLSGHFMAYSIRLTPMDGVYYCDIRPNMTTDPFLSQRIKTLDRLFFNELLPWIDS